MRTKAFFTLCIALITTPNLFAWGADGHRIIGRAAYELLDERARQEVSQLLGTVPGEEMAAAISTACNWPDTIRDEPQWAWSSPLHYVNIPRHSTEYDRERDCPDGRCVTEGILQFANQLAYEDLEQEKKWQAFAFVCHLVADLHQPLHAGFKDDRGANSVNVEYGSEQWNLHQFWDSVLVHERLQDEEGMVRRLGQAGQLEAGQNWDVRNVKTWTEASHALADRRAYPDTPVIDEEFADRSWALTVEQWEKAAGRLAQVLNAVLGDGDTRLE